MGLFDRRGQPKPSAAPPAPARNPAADQFRVAMELGNQDRHGEALEAFRRVIGLDPRFQPELVHYGMAVAYDGIGMGDAAAGELRTVISINPVNIEARITLGTIYARTNRLDLAIGEYETVLSMRPGHELAPELRRSIDEWKADAAGGPMKDVLADLRAFIGQAEARFRIRLDLSPGSLAAMDRLIDGGWNPRSGGLGVLHIAGAYFGEVVIQNLHGRWRAGRTIEESEIDGLGASGVKPFFIVLDKFKRGREASLLESYNGLVAELERVRGTHG